MKQIRCKMGIHFLLTSIALFGWWGLFFPEFTLNQDTVVVCVKDSSSLEDAQTNLSYSGDELLELLLQAQPKDITFRSKLLEEFKLFWEDFSWDILTWN